LPLAVFSLSVKVLAKGAWMAVAGTTGVAALGEGFLCRVTTASPARDVLELTAVVRFGPRVRVLAIRLERAADCAASWRCTALESA